MTRPASIAECHAIAGRARARGVADARLLAIVLAAIERHPYALTDVRAALDRAVPAKPPPDTHDEDDEDDEPAPVDPYEAPTWGRR